MATLKGIFPNSKPTRRKNFIQENVRNLRRMEQFFHTKEVEDLQKLQLQKKTVDKYQNVTSRINSSLRNGKCEEGDRKSSLRRSDTNLNDDARRPERGIGDALAGKNAGDDKKIYKSPGKTNCASKSKATAKSSGVRDNKMTKAFSNLNFREEESKCDADDNCCVKYRNQGIQTLSEDDISVLYREGVIRYPSSGKSKNDGGPTRNGDGLLPGECLPSDRGDILSTDAQRHNFGRSTSPPASFGDQADRSKLNKRKATVAGKMAEQLNNGVPLPNYRKGVVPKYIRDRKEAQQQRDEKIKAATSHPDCPEGHLPLPDDERKETLRMLKKHYQDYVNELNMMPIKTDTLKSQRRKMEIEKQLNKLEEGIKVFSRPKVYVKVDA